MNSRPRLSVAMCTYNGARFLSTQLESLARQERLPDELVVCDDLSTDATRQVVSAFAAEAPFPVRFVANETNLGSTKNFEKAIGLCSGELIALSDQDDVWDPRKLRLLEQRFTEEPDLGFVFSDAEMVDQDLRPLGYTLWQSVRFGVREQKACKGGRALGALLHHNFVTGATMAFDARLRPLVTPISSAWVHDAWLAALISASGASIAFVDIPLMKYRQHAGQQLGAAMRTLSGDVSTLLENPREFSKRAAGEYAGAIRRCDGMLEHMIARGLPDAAIRLLGEKREHVSTRAALPRSFPARLARIMLELARGRYFRYSNGWRSVMKDLLPR